ncbi:hypothetical protein [Azospirillum palustre]
MAPTPQVPFPATELLDELRTILLFTADFLAMTRSAEAAAAFIGFDSEQYHSESPSRVALHSFRVAPTMTIIYDYAFQVGEAHRFSEAHLQDALVFIDGVPRVGGQGAEGGMTHPYMGEDGLCRRAITTANARWKLEKIFNFDLSVRELALLAGMTEGAVRNALAAAGIKAKGSRTYVSNTFAREWLAGRRGFVPTTCWEYTPDAAHLDIRTARTVSDLSLALTRRAEQKGLSVTALATASTVVPERTAAWLTGTPDLDVATAVALATALDLDPALVAGRTVELLLRQSS